MAKARHAAKKTPVAADIVPTPLELMAGHAWRGAFFTTYSMSISFLETQVIPVLEEKERCEIEVFVDAKGYRDSLFERHSWRVGQDYRLVPVAMPTGGCFHPKTALLWGAEGGLLLIGSGNLTFGGHGRNLEVFEAFEPTRDAPVFAGFAEFLAALRDRLGDRLLESRTVTRALLEAERMAGSASPGRVEDLRPQIVHSVRRPILEQIVGLAEGLGMGKCTQAIVMSPFFDADGDTIQRLAKALRCERVRVAVPAFADENRFPFAVAAGWNAKIESVRLDGEDSRRLHAKVLELQFEGGTLVLTGSVNATRPALGSTDNIEVGVLRLFESAHYPWVPAPTPPGVATDDDDDTDDEHERIVHAVVTKEGRLLGRLLGTDAGCIGSWQASVSSGGVDLAAFSVEVAADGRFASDDFDIESVIGLGALQIVLRRPDARARGWLQIEALLMGAKMGRMSPTEILRLSLGKGTSADVTALLEYLARHLVHDRTLRRAFRSRTEASEPDDVVIGPLDLMAMEGRPEPGDPDHGAETRMTLERIRRFLLRRPAVALSIEDEGISEEDPGTSGSEIGSGGKTPPRKPVEQTFSIAEFQDMMRRALAERSGNPEDTAEALTVWFEGLMAAYLHAKDDRAEEARSFLQFWTMKALQETGRGVTPALDGMAVTAAAIAFAIGRRAAQPAVRLAALRSAFDRWWGGDVDPKQARVLLLDRALMHVAELVGLAEVGHGHEWDAAGALDGLLAIETPARMVRYALERWRSGLPTVTETAIFSTRAGQAFCSRLAVLPAAGRPLPPGALPNGVAIGETGSDSCPSCHRALLGGPKELDLRGVAQCGWCGKVVVRTEG